MEIVSDVNGKIPRSYGLGVIAISMYFFYALNQYLMNKRPASVELSNDWKWRNLLASWFHAFIVGSWDIACLYQESELWSDMVERYSYFSYTMVAVSTGYFFYDFIDIIMTQKIKSVWELLIHHVVVAGMFFYNLMTCRCIAYNIIALMAEINSFFLHSRKLMQMSKVDFSSLPYQINIFLNLGSFIVCRFFAVGVIIVGMVYEHERVSFVYFMCLFISIFCMFFINIILFYRLVKNDIFRGNVKYNSLGGEKSDKLGNGCVNHEIAPPCKEQLVSSALPHTNNNSKQNVPPRLTEHTTKTE